MKTRYVYPFIVLLVLLFSLAPLHVNAGENGFEVQTTDHDISMSQLTKDSEHDRGLSTISRDIFTQMVSFYEAFDGGYTNDRPNDENTYNMYKVFEQLGTNTSMMNSFVQFVEDRYRGSNYDLSWAPLTQVGKDYYSSDETSQYNGGDQVHWKEMIAMELGYTFSSDIINRTVNNALNYINQDLSNINIYTLYSYVHRLNASNALDQLDKTKIISILKNLQVTDTSSDFYGGIKSSLSNSYVYLVSTLRALQTMRLADIPINNLDLNALFDFVNTSRYTSQISNNYMGLDYTLGFGDNPQNINPTDLYWGHDIPDTMAGMTIMKLLDAYLTTGYNFTGGIELILNNNYNLYWIDENGDNIIDREPYHRYLDHDINRDDIEVFRTFLSVFDVTNQIDFDLFFREISAIHLKKGGIVNSNWGGSSVDDTTDIIEILYLLDTEGLSYLDSSMISNYINYVESHFAVVNWYNGSEYIDILGIIPQSVRYHDFADRNNFPNNEISTHTALQYMDMLSKLGYVDAINQTLKNHTNLKMEVESGYTQSSNLHDYNPNHLENQFRYTNLFDYGLTTADKDYIIEQMSKYKTFDGGFVDYLRWDDTLIHAKVMEEIDSSYIDSDKVVNNVKSYLIEDDQYQGIYRYPGQSWWNNEWDDNNKETSLLLQYLNQTGELQNLLVKGHLNASKLIAGMERELLSNNFLEYWSNDETDLRNLEHYVKALDALGYTKTEIRAHVNSTVNLTRTIEYIQDLQITPADADNSLIAGGFARYLDNPHDRIVSTSEQILSTKRAVSILFHLDALSEVDETALSDFVDKMYIQDTNSPDLGLFRQYGNQDGIDLYDQKEGFELAGYIDYATPYDIGQRIIDRINYTDYDQEYYNEWEFRAVLELLGYGGFDISDFNTKLIDQLLPSMITESGFISNQGIASISNSIDAYNVLESLGRTSTSLVSDITQYVASLQTLDYKHDRWRYGGFSRNSYDNDYNVAYTSRVIILLDKIGDFSSIHLSPALEFVGHRIREYNNTHEYHFAIWEVMDLLEAASAISDYAVLYSDIPRYVKTGEDITLWGTGINLYGDSITNMGIEVKMDGSSVASVTSPSSGEYKIDIDSNLFDTAGTYDLVVTSTHPDYKTLTQTFKIKAVDNPLTFYKQWDSGNPWEWDNYRVEGYLYGADNDTIWHDEITIDWEVTGPVETYAHDFNWWYDDWNGWINFEIWPNQEPVEGDYTLTVTINTLYLGDLTLNFDFHRDTEDRDDTEFTEDPETSTNEDTDEPFDADNGPRITLPGFELVIAITFFLLAIPVRRLRNNR